MKLALGLIGLCAAARVAAAQPVEVRASRGVAGVVASGGIDVVEVEVVSGADAPATVQLAIDGRSRPVALAARGRATVTVGRRVPAGAGSLPAVRVAIGEVSLDVPAARVVRRPILVIADDAAGALTAVAAWRPAELGPPVLITPDAVPARWQALLGAGAVVLDRPIEALDAGAARTVSRFLASGGQVCRIHDAVVGCVRAAPVAAPQTPVRATSAAAPRRLGAVAALLALVLALAAIVRSRAVRGAAIVVGVAAAAAMVLVGEGGAMRATGVRVAGGDEDWVAAEIGVAERGGLPRLDGDLWIEPSGAGQTLGPLDESGFAGRVTAAGSWKVRGFVAGDGGGWARRLQRVEREAVAP